MANIFFAASRHPDHRAGLPALMISVEILAILESDVKRIAEGKSMRRNKSGGHFKRTRHRNRRTVHVDDGIFRLQMLFISNNGIFPKTKKLHQA